MTQAQTIEQLRAEAGLGVRDMGVDQAHYIAIKSGRRKAGPNALRKIAAALGKGCPEVHAAIEAQVAAVSRRRRQARG